jgi:cytochrome c biogenesis protein CcmG, thiol:disulfide interchange protein DsbE
MKGSTALRKTAPQAGLRLVSCLAAAVSALALGACGASDAAGPISHPDYQAALRGAPAPLASIYRQGDRILPGGTSAFDARLRSLRGYPVIVNDWASWCEPCRAEIPLLGRAAARYGKRIAFLGVDGEDHPAAARTFLRERPLPYPSFDDPDSAIAASQGGVAGYPRTAFYDRRGKLVFLKQGPYSTVGELGADIRRHLD